MPGRGASASSTASSSASGASRFGASSGSDSRRSSACGAWPSSISDAAVSGMPGIWEGAGSRPAAGDASAGESAQSSDSGKSSSRAEGRRSSAPAFRIRTDPLSIRRGKRRLVSGAALGRCLGRKDRLIYVGVAIGGGAPCGANQDREAASRSVRQRERLGRARRRCGVVTCLASEEAAG